MKEQHKLKLVIDYEGGKVRAQKAAELLGITKRQFRRIVAAYRQQGIAALADGPKHGYAMMSDIQAISGVRLGPGTLYGALTRLEKSGLIEAMPAEDQRRPYRLTGKGLQALREELELLEKLVTTGLKRLAAG
jgi:DNA-binding PadR family transcriptional regulator